jgi:hypothetical protein
MGRYRKRQKVGMRCVTIEIRKAEIAGLVRAGLLNSDGSNDVSALKAAPYIDISRKHRLMVARTLPS